MCESVCEVRKILGHLGGALLLQASSFFVQGWPFIGPCVVLLSSAPDSAPPPPRRAAGRLRTRALPLLPLDVQVSMSLRQRRTAGGGTFRLGAYNLGAQNSTFEKCANEVYGWSTCADVLCIQAISRAWITRLAEVLMWKFVDAHDGKAIFWRHGINMTSHGLLPFFPFDKRRHRQGVLRAALRLKRAFWFHGSAWGRAFLLSGPSASGSSTVDP